MLRRSPRGTADAAGTGRTGSSGRPTHGDLRVEYEEPLTFPCECCGKPNVRLTRFVSRDGDAHAVYLVRYWDAPGACSADAIVSLGTWWVDGVPPDRVAFALRITATADEYRMEVTDAGESPWGSAEHLGRKLGRDEALAHPWFDEVRRIFDHMVQHDPPLHRFLAGAGDA